MKLKFKNQQFQIDAAKAVTDATDAVEFMLAGASAIEIGTANFIDPSISAKVANGMKDYCERHGFEKVFDLTGALEA